MIKIYQYIINIYIYIINDMTFSGKKKKDY